MEGSGGRGMTGWRQARTSTQKFPRRATAVPVRIATVDPEIDPDTGTPFFRATEATTANLSRGGVFVHSWEPLAAGRRVIVALDLPAGGELQLVGQVVWTRRQLTAQGAGPVEIPGYGIEFVAPTRADQAAIQQILDAPRPAETPSSSASASDSPSASPTTPEPLSAAPTPDAGSSSPASPSGTSSSTASPKLRPAFPPIA